jgi:hypothetical protein
MNDFYEKADRLREKLEGAGNTLSLAQPMAEAVAAAIADDPVEHPAHYTAHPSGVECIQITEHMNFNLGNVIKYVWRSEEKGGVEDLRKAAWYLQREIARLEGSGA